MRKFESIVAALTGFIAIAVIALPAGAAHIFLTEDGASELADVQVGDFVILDHSWRLETDEFSSGWAWSIACNGCVIEEVRLEFLGGASGPPSTPTGQIDWWGNFSVIAPSLPNFSIYYDEEAEQSVAGSIGGANTAGSQAGPGTDVALGWVTVHITAATGSVTPYFRNIDGIGGSGGAVDATFGGVTWDAPEPMTAALQGAAVLSLAMLYRKRR